MHNSRVKTIRCLFVKPSGQDGVKMGSKIWQISLKSFAHVTYEQSLDGEEHEIKALGLEAERACDVMRTWSVRRLK